VRFVEKPPVFAKENLHGGIIFKCDEKGYD
jgi:hypothetical protein